MPARFFVHLILVYFFYVPAVGSQPGPMADQDNRAAEPVEVAAADSAGSKIDATTAGVGGYRTRADFTMLEVRDLSP